MRAVYAALPVLPPAEGMIRADSIDALAGTGLHELPATGPVPARRELSRAAVRRWWRAAVRAPPARAARLRSRTPSSARTRRSGRSGSHAPPGPRRWQVLPPARGRLYPPFLRLQHLVRCLRLQSHRPGRRAPPAHAPAGCRRRRTRPYPAPASVGQCRNLRPLACNDAKTDQTSPLRRRRW